MIKSVKLLKIVDNSAVGVMFVSGDDDDAPWVRTDVILTRDEWVEMGEPDVITVTIEPGDKLNEPR